MQNSKCKMRSARRTGTYASASRFFFLHFAFRILHYSWRVNSYSAIATAVATFTESTPLAIGMRA